MAFHSFECRNCPLRNINKQTPEVLHCATLPPIPSLHHNLCSNVGPASLPPLSPAKFESASAPPVREPPKMPSFAGVIQTPDTTRPSVPTLRAKPTQLIHHTPSPVAKRTGARHRFVRQSSFFEWLQKIGLFPPRRPNFTRGGQRTPLFTTDAQTADDWPPNQTPNTRQHPRGPKQNRLCAAYNKISRVPTLQMLPQGRFDVKPIPRPRKDDCLPNQIKPADPRTPPLIPTSTRKFRPSHPISSPPKFARGARLNKNPPFTKTHFGEKGRAQEERHSNTSCVSNTPRIKPAEQSHAADSLANPNRPPQSEVQNSHHSTTNISIQGPRIFRKKSASRSPNSRLMAAKIARSIRRLAPSFLHRLRLPPLFPKNDHHLPHKYTSGLLPGPLSPQAKAQASFAATGSNLKNALQSPRNMLLRLFRQNAQEETRQPSIAALPSAGRGGNKLENSSSAVAPRPPSFPPYTTRPSAPRSKPFQPLITRRRQTPLIAHHKIVPLRRSETPLLTQGPPRQQRPPRFGTFPFPTSCPFGIKRRTGQRNPNSVVPKPPGPKQTYRPV